MRFGVYLPAFGELADPRALATLAADAEAAGWEGAFLWDHLRYDTDTDVADPWVALAAMACATETIRLGPLITPLARRRVQVVARQATTLDHLSGGRVTLGVGLGIDYWREFEGFDEAATDDRQRAAIVDESLGVLLGLWSGATVDHEGDHLTVRGVRFLPRPLQEPRIPVWSAAIWPRTAGLRRSARLDGVMPFDGRGNNFGGADVRRILDVVAAHRPEEMRARPFDVVIAGAVQQMPLAELSDAGATWALEALIPLTPLAAAREAVDAGPPG